METITVTEGDYESPAFVTKDEWKQILSNKDIMKRSHIDALIAFYLEPGHKSSLPAKLLVISTIYTTMLSMALSLSSASKSKKN